MGWNDSIGKWFFSPSDHWDCLWGPLSFIFNGCSCYFPEDIVVVLWFWPLTPTWRQAKRMSGAVPLLPLYVFVEWTGTTLSPNEDNTGQDIVVVMLHILIQEVPGWKFSQVFYCFLQSLEPDVRVVPWCQAMNDFFQILFSSSCMNLVSRLSGMVYWYCCNSFPTPLLPPAHQNNWK